jgi:quercetin dioxygenase-like cupin family protein
MTTEQKQSLRSVKIVIAAATLAAVVAAPVTAQSLGKFVVTKMAEMPASELPAGELYWHVENFTSLAQAEAAKGDFSLATEFDDRAWLFTLADRKAAGMGGTPVTSIGPVPRFDAPEYLLRINSATAPAGARTSVHTHPGPEAFLILSGQLTQRTPYGQHVLNAGGTMPGVPDQAMEVQSSGDEELRELIMFIVDPTRPFSEEAQLQ